MKKEFVILFALFIVFGMIFASAFVIAEKSEDNLEKGKLIAPGEKIEVEDNEKQEDSKDSMDNDEENEDMQDGEQNEIKSEKKFKFINENGKEVETKISIEQKTENNGENDKIKNKIKIESNGENKEIESELEIESEGDFENGTLKFKTKTSNGETKEIKILPSEISQRAEEILKSKNFTIQIKEKEHNNLPTVVYHIESDKTGKFLGVFKMKYKIQSDVDVESGEVTDVNVPWWALVLFGKDLKEMANENVNNSEE